MAAPSAIEDHLQGSADFEVASLVDAPRAVAWNTMVAAVQTQAPIATASYSQGNLQTQWIDSGTVIEDGVATQTRHRFSIALRGQTAADFAANVSAEAESRSRTTCGEPSDWAGASPPTTDQIAAAANAALSELGQVELDSLQFPASEEAALEEVRDLLLARWGLAPAPSGLRFPLESGWRTTAHAVDDSQIYVRSNLTVRAIPVQAPSTMLDNAATPPDATASATPPSSPSSAAPEAVGPSEPTSDTEPFDGPIAPDFGGAPNQQKPDEQMAEVMPAATRVVGEYVRIAVDTQLEWRAQEAEDGTAWQQGDSSGVTTDFYGRLAAVLPPARIRIAAQEPREIHAPPRATPPLPAPADPLEGRYALFVRLVQMPLSSPDGSDWDAGAVLASLIRMAPTVVRIVSVMMGDFTSVMQFAKDTMAAVQERGAVDRVAGLIADRVGEIPAPDIQVGLGLGGEDVVGLNGEDNSHVAGWVEPVYIELDGDRSIPWVVYDRDPRNWDLAGQGAFSASELANACAPVCQRMGADGQICLELRRQ